jgi:hypothetical protein
MVMHDLFGATTTMWGLNTRLNHRIKRLNRFGETYPQKTSISNSSRRIYLRGSGPIKYLADQLID